LHHALHSFPTRRSSDLVLERCTVPLLVDQRCPHHPETTAGRSPLEVEHPIKGILRGPLRLSVIPRKPVSLHVVFLDREHTLDDSDRKSTRLNSSHVKIS